MLGLGKGCVMVMIRVRETVECFMVMIRITVGARG